MADEENPGAEDELTLPSQKSVNNGGSVPPNPASDAVAQLNADTHTRLDRALDSASQANRKMEFYAKRLAGGAAVVVFLCAVLLWWRAVGCRVKWRRCRPQPCLLPSVS